MRVLIIAAFWWLGIGLLQAQPQAPQWVIPPYVIDFSGANITTSNLTAAPPASYSGANGQFDENGNLLFYVIDDQILDPAGNVVTHISTVNSGPGSRNHIIVPVPEVCDEYFVIYHYPGAGGLSSDLFFTKIEVSPGSVSVANNQVNIQFGTGSFETNTYAVSPLRPDRTRFLYNSSYNLTQKFVISQTGITFSSSTSNLAGFQAELDLSHDGTKLALVGPFDNQVRILELNAAGNFTSTLQTISIPLVEDLSGVEFSADGLKVVVSGKGYNSNSQSGIYVIDLSGTQPVITYVSGSSAFDYSQVELAYDGKMYFANSTTLGSLDLSGNTLNANVLSLSNIGLSYGSYVLPHQADGEDYAYARGYL